MKVLILNTILFLSAMSTVSASSDPVDALKVISTAKVVVSLNDVGQLDMFKDAIFFPQANVIKFETKSKMKFIQVFDSAGTMIYQLPVRSTKVRISKSLFSKGDYRLGFMVENESEILFTNLTVN
jgi:hypothetical protein